MIFAARLVGGIFDGDAGQMEAPALPLKLWAYACDQHAACPVGGVHWVMEAAGVPDDVSPSIYVYHSQDKAAEGVSIYRHIDMEYDGLFEEKAVEVPA